ncbi:MAG TPA: hypothetical protein VJM51_00330 [Dehalococcoidia bacterium]|nr:hypothetical protein [Dehalococcoidia bacterium]
MLERSHTLLVRNTTGRPYTYVLHDPYHGLPLEWLSGLDSYSEAPDGGAGSDD